MDAYLAECGVDAAKIEDVSHTFGRNLVVRVSLKNGESLFIKQGRDKGPRQDGALLNEGLFHFFAESRGIAESKNYLVRCRLHDRKSDVLIFEQIPNTESLRERVERTGRLSAEMAYHVGVSLGEIHSLSNKDQSRDVTVLGRESENSVISQVSALTPETLALLSPVEIELFKAIQGDAELSQRLETLDATWKRLCLTHGDFRMENILVRKQVRRTPLLIDWELASYADPAADLGSFVGDVLRTCIDRTKPAKEDTTKWSSDANKLFERFSKALAAFWEGYSHSARAILSSRPSLPMLTGSHAGVFLLNRVRATGQVRISLRPHDLMYIAVGKRCVCNPKFVVDKLD